MNSYLQRHKFCEPQIAEPPSENLGIVIVIPCFYEPDLTTALSSLYNCDRPGCDVEVIVVVNSPEDSPGDVLEQNIRTIREANAWILKHKSPPLTPPKGGRTGQLLTLPQSKSDGNVPPFGEDLGGADIDKKLRFHILHFPELPKKHAGVGLARKIGMDEAVSRFAQSAECRAQGGKGLERGKRYAPCALHHALIIVNFDADCQCEKNYLKSIESHFKNNLKTPACSIYYEHPLKSSGDSGKFKKEIYKKENPEINRKSGFIIPKSPDDLDIIKYELFLRYYVIALRYSGYPYAYYTIGSCMAVRSAVYQKQGGMNRRQAGEDFYFLQKIIQLGNFTELTATTVYPSSRRSTRVPFGTGKAISGRMSASPGDSEDHLGSRGQGARSWVKKGLKVGNAPELLGTPSSIRYTYNPKTFDDLKIFFSKIPLLYQMGQAGKFLDKLPVSISAFLIKNDFIEHLTEIQANTVSEKTFIKRFYRWFNGLKVLQFVHFARDNFYDNIPVEDAAVTLLRSLNYLRGNERKTSAKDLLLRFREMEKKPCCYLWKVLEI